MGPPRNENARSGLLRALLLRRCGCYTQYLARAPGPVKAKRVYDNVNSTARRLTHADDPDNTARLWPRRLTKPLLVGYIRSYSQDRIGGELNAPPTPGETAWLNADLG